MLAIKSRWECPACGNVIPVLEPFATKQQRKASASQDGPKRCGCGRNGGFMLLSFEPTSLVEEKKAEKGEEGEEVE